MCSDGPPQVGVDEQHRPLVRLAERQRQVRRRQRLAFAATALAIMTTFDAVDGLRVVQRRRPGGGTARATPAASCRRRRSFPVSAPIDRFQQRRRRSRPPRRSRRVDPHVRWTRRIDARLRADAAAASAAARARRETRDSVTSGLVGLENGRRLRLIGLLPSFALFGGATQRLVYSTHSTLPPKLPKARIRRFGDADE